MKRVARIQQRGTSTTGLLLFAIVLPACGRTALPPATCRLHVDGTSSDFGEVAPGERSERSVRLTNTGAAVCTLSPGMRAGSDPAFTLVTPPSPSLAPGE